MNNYAIIDANGNVLNIIVWDGVSEYNPGTGLQLIQISEGQTVNIGDVYNGTEFIQQISSDETVITVDDGSDDVSAD
jgi:hypothetical protein